MVSPALLRPELQVLYAKYVDYEAENEAAVPHSPGFATLEEDTAAEELGANPVADMAGGGSGGGQVELSEVSAGPESYQRSGTAGGDGGGGGLWSAGVTEAPQGRGVEFSDPRLALWFVAPGKPAFATQLTTSLAMLGSIGLFTTLLQWPILFLLDATGAETFEPPGPAGVMGQLLANCGLDTLFNVLLLFGIGVTSPVFMSVGTMLVAPITVIVDALKPHAQSFDWKGWVGIIFVVGAFALLELPPKYVGFQKCSRFEPCKKRNQQPPASSRR